MSQKVVAGVEGRTFPRLLAAVRLLFVSRGYYQTRPQDNTRQAGVGSGTFYLYFTDRQAAFLEFAEQTQNELIDLFRERLSDLACCRWRCVCAKLLQFAERHRGILRAALIDSVFMAPNNEDAWRIYGRLGQLISHRLWVPLRHTMIYARHRKMDKEQLLDNISLFYS